MSVQPAESAQAQAATIAATNATEAVEKEAAHEVPAAEPTEKEEASVTEEQKVDEPKTLAEPGEPAETAQAQAAAMAASNATEAVEKQAAEGTEEKNEQKATNVVAEAPLPATTPAPNSGSELTWPETPADHPLTKFFESFEELTKEAEHSEVWGITLSKTNAFQTKLILQKYLRANANDLTKAKEQLLDTLKWRKEFDPVKAKDESHEKERFEGLGYILKLENVPESANKTDICTFNIYGAVKDNKKTFGDLNGFLRWRVGLMERSIDRLGLQVATEPIPDYGQGPDPYQAFQVHDYLQVSFIRQDPLVKAATKKTIQVLGRYYPETLSRKFFVNVPVVMGWIYTATKLFVAKETINKFVVLSYGNQLAAKLGPGIPEVYGGTKGELKEIGEGMKLD